VLQLTCNIQKWMFCSLSLKAVHLVIMYHMQNLKKKAKESLNQLNYIIPFGFVL